MHIGKRIAKLRRVLNYSQEELAKGIVSASHLSNIEAGRYVPSKDILIPLAKSLGVPESYLLKFDQHDGKLEGLLHHYYKSIISNLKAAKEIREQIHQDFRVIYSVEQEIYFNLCESSFLLKIRDLDQALKVYDQDVVPYIKGLKVEKALPDSLKELYFYFNGGRCFYQLRYAESLSFYRKQLPLVLEKEYGASTHYNLSLLYQKLDQTEKAIHFSLEALESYLKSQWWEDIAKTYNLLGVLYYEKRDFMSAKDYLSKALEAVEFHDLSFPKARIYHNFGMLYKGMNHFEESESFYLKALELKKPSQDPETKLTYRTLADLYLRQDKIELAEAVLKEALLIDQNEKETYMLKIPRARLNLHYGNEAEYERLMKEAIHYLYKNQQWKGLKEKIAVYADYLSKRRRNKEAVHYYRLEIEIRDNIDREGAK